MKPEVAEPDHDSALANEPVVTLEHTYRAISTDLTRFAAGMVGVDEAADVVASAVARCLRVDWSTVDNGTAYLYRAVYNEATGLRRRFARRSGLTHRIPRSPTTTDPAEPDVDNRLVVAEALATLSPQQRAVVVLTCWHALPVREVATHLDLSDGTVKKQLARARATLREELS
jgi:RNA polymerase sigma-70 factor (ECF subfamily)